MFLAGKAFWTAKAGNSEAEYEDAFWPIVDAEWDVRSFRYAIADGATQASFSRLWAQLLVRAYCKGQLGSHKLHKPLRALQDRWTREVAKKPLPWFAQEKVRQGAFAAILGVTFIQHDENDEDAQDDGLWTAFALGDSCLFHIRNNQLLLAFPLKHSEDFNNSPMLLSSNPLNNTQIEAVVLMHRGSWRKGDLFFLMTDAMACWFLRRLEDLSDPILQLTAVRSQEEFIQLVERERQCLDDEGRKIMRNDDLTFFRIFAA